MIADIAKLDTGGTIFEKEYVRNNYKSNLGRTCRGFTDFFSLPRTRQNHARKSAKPDLTYPLFGQKSVTKMDVENFNKSENILSIPQKGYIHAIGAESARRLKGKDSGVLKSFLYLGENMGEDVEHARLNLDLLTSAFQLGLRFLDECYRDASRESLVKGDLGNIRQNMYYEKLSLTTLGDVKTEFTPSHHESCKIQEKSQWKESTLATGTGYPKPKCPVSCVNYVGRVILLHSSLQQHHVYPNLSSNRIFRCLLHKRHRR